MRSCTYFGVFNLLAAVSDLAFMGHCTLRSCDPGDVSCNLLPGLLYSGQCPATNTNPEALRLSGLVTTIAGVAGTADGPGTSARFDGPNGLTADFQNLYLAEPTV